MIAITLVATIALGANYTLVNSNTAKKVTKYTCEFDAGNPYPDGTTGVAETGVKITGNGSTFVSVEYYSDDYQDYLGQYQEGNGDFVPSTKEEACNFALDHFNDRQ